MKKSFIFILIVLALAASAFAQTTDMATLQSGSSTPSLGVKPAANVFSLLDLSRIKWSNSYSVSYFSGGFGSGGAGLLRTGMLYEFSPKLSMSLNLGVMHSLGGVMGNVNNQPTLLPGMRLDYHPSEKFRMILDVQRVSGLVTPYSDYSPYWGSPFYGR